MPGFRADELPLETGEIRFESSGWGGRQLEITDIDGDGGPDFLVAGRYVGPEIDNSNAVVVTSDGTQFVAVAALASPSVDRGPSPPPVSVAATMPFAGIEGDCVRFLVGTGGQPDCSCTDPQDLAPDVLLYERATLATDSFLQPTRQYVREPDVSDPSELGRVAGGFFGNAVAIGDFNGDGHADQVVGAFRRALEDVTPVKDHGRAYGFRFCPGDFDSNGTADFFDSLHFQDLFGASDPRADLDCNGVIDFFDFLAAQDAIGAGCP